VFDDRPELNGEFNISISHHDGFAVAALAHKASCGVVGVDLEWDRPLADRLVHRVLTANERDRLNAAESAHAPSNMALWCLKEAVLKASREASRISMWQVELSWDRRGQMGQVAAHILDRDGDDTRFSAVWRRRGAHVLAYAIHSSANAN
jgi:4'-phosphopantetheinyl transferase EntD